MSSMNTGEQIVLVSLKCRFDHRYSEDLLNEPAFDMKADLLNSLDLWVKLEGGVRRDERVEPTYFRMIEEETDHDRSLRIQYWRVIARYMFSDPLHVA